MATLDRPTVDVWAPLDPEVVRRIARTRRWLNPEALQLVVQDANRAEAFENTKQWVMQWPTATALYQSPFTARYWEGTMTERANVPFFTVATAVESLVPQIINGLFYENPPFVVQPRPGTDADAARARGAILAYQLEDINFRDELRLGAKNAVLFGTGIWKWGFETFERERKVYKRVAQPLIIQNPLASAGAEPISLQDQDEDIEEESITEYIDRPFFEHIVNLRHVLVDPTCNVPDIRKAKYVIHRLYLTWGDLEKLRERPGFDIPSREQLIDLFNPPKEPVEKAVGETSIRNPLWDARADARYEEATIDPTAQPLEVLERWDNEKYIVVLQKKIVICNDQNPYGVIPYLSVGWWDVPEAFFSLGLAKTIGSEQRLQQGITNLWLDNAALNLNGVYTRVRGKSVPTQNIRIAPGKIIDVDNKDDFAPVKRLDPVPEAAQHIGMSQQRAEQVSGASESSMQGVAGASGHSNLARTAEGVRSMNAGTGSRVTDFVEKISTQVIIPFLYAADELNRALLPVSTMKEILNDELQHEYTKKQGWDVLEILNARLKFSILAGAKMQARRNMAQALPIMIQFLTNQQTTEQLAVAGYRVDVPEIMKMMFEVSDWKNYNSVVVKMTPEDMKRHEAMQPGAQAKAKAQAAMAMQQQQHNNKLDLIDNENIARAGREILRHALMTSGTQEEVEGTPGNAGFGENA